MLLCPLRIALVVLLSEECFIIFRVFVGVLYLYYIQARLNLLNIHFSNRKKGEQTKSTEADVCKTCGNDEKHSGKCHKSNK